MSGLDKSQARWNILAQQVIMAQFGRSSRDGQKYAMDAWDGYPAERARLMDFIATSKPRNPIVLSGDSHTNLVSDLKADFNKSHSAVVGVEFAGTSISSSGSTIEGQKAAEADVAAQPHLKWFEGTKRGYVSCTVERGQWRSDFMQVDNVVDAASPVTIGSSWVVLDGTPGVHAA
jgi:alkaline phosphatase D